MGDAEQIGLALDAVHRPKRQTAILSRAGICILLGAIFRILSQDSLKLFTLAAPLPFITGNLYSVIDALLLGLSVSALRQATCPEPPEIRSVQPVVV